MHRFKIPRLIPTLFMLLLFPLLQGQEVDHVYLKNGSIIRGKILEIQPEDHLKILDLCGNIWSYQMNQVDKITSEPYQPDQRIKRAALGFGTGFVNMTSIGFLAGSPQNERTAPLSLQMVNGWRNSLGIFTGLGIGVEFLNTNYMPLFFDLRYDLFGSDVVPYVLARAGYSLPLRSDHEEYEISYSYDGGPLIGLGFGLKIKSRNHFAWDVAMMYRYQKTGYQEVYDWNNQEYTYTDVYNRIEIRIGFYID